MEHLNPAIREIVLLGQKERIQRIRAERWIGYTRSKEILDKMEDLLDYPSSHRMPNLLLVGETNNGKTALVNRFLSRHQAYIKQEIEGVKAPVIMIQAPPIPDEKRLYDSILKKVFAPFRVNDRVEKKQLQVIQILTRMELKVLIIDEIHHLLSGSLSKQRSFRNVLKYLANELQISLVCVGIADAFNAIQTDPQLANRFEPTVLHKWRMDEEYLRLLASYESLLPLRKPSDLTEDTLALKILSMSEGTIGEITAILRTAAISAIMSGKECITAKLLEELKWLSPSDRKRQIEKVR
jgi:type II secretory pathway predicted ATPase ExeA